MATVNQSQELPKNSTTRQNITQRFLRETKAGEYGTTTATGADATELIDTTKLKSGAKRREQYVGAWIRIPDVGSAGYHGQIRSIVDYKPETGTLIVEPPFSASVPDAINYEIYRLVHPQDLLDDIATLFEENYFEPVFVMLSELNNYDMEAGTGGWNNGSNSTVLFTEGVPGMRGRYGLSVELTGADGYATNANAIYVVSGESYTLSALVKCSTGSAKLILYDETNGATIDTLTSEEQTTVRLYKSIAIPSTCKEVTVHLSNSSPTGFAYWDDIVFFRDGEADIRLPGYIKDDSFVKAVYRWVPTTLIGGSNPNVYTPELRGRRTHAWQYQQDLYAYDGEARLVSLTERMTYPLMALVVRNRENYSGTTPDSQAQNLDRNYVHACLCAKYYSNLLSSHVGSTVSAKAIETNFIKWDKAKRIAEYTHATRIEMYLKAPEPWSSYSRED